MKLISSHKHFILAAAIISIAGGVAVLAGWVFHIEPLKRTLPGFSTMKFNTSLCFILSGILLFYYVCKTKPPAILLHFIPTVIILIGSISFSEDIVGYNSGMDELFMTDNATITIDSFSSPGRMSTSSSFCFILLGLSFLFVRLKNHVVKIVSQFALHTVTLIAAVSIMGYLYKIPVFYASRFPGSMALHTSVLFFILSIATSFVNSSFGITGLFTGNRLGSIMAKRLFPLIALFLVVLGFLRIEAHRFNLISVEAGTTLFVLLCIVLCLMLIYITAKYLNKIDSKREEAEKALSSLNKNLEQLIAERSDALIKAMEKLKKNEEKFRNLLESAPDAIVIVNKEGVIQLVNAQTEKIFGYKKEELLGQKVEILIPQRFVANHSHHRTDFFASPKARNMGAGLELFGKKKDGKELPVEISLSPLETEEGILVSAAIRDVTDRKKAEENLRILNEQLVRSNSELEQFAYVASHDLQEPLRMVSSFLQLLEKKYKPKLDETAAQYIHFAVDGADRMKVLIKDLLAFSRVGSTKQELELVDIAKVVEDTKSVLRMAIEEKGAIIRSGPLPALNADSLMISQIFQNLVGNAIKYTGTEKPVVEIGYSETDNHWLFSVKDNGIGIAPKYFDKIFVVFQRLHTKSSYSGTGIGLAICKKIAEKHGGKIWVESSEGKGSTFYFTISKN